MALNHLTNQYSSEIQSVVNSALSELAEEHRAGRVVNAPVANNHFLVRWVTKAIKEQRFNRVVSADLLRWQKAGRSKGNDAALLSTFRRISALYGQFFPANETPKVLHDATVEQFLDVMEQAGWEVSTSEPLVNVGKVQIFTDGQNSLALCANQCESSFDGSVMVKPMNWFVRGNHNQFVESATEAGFLVHKVTDYKSNVKYHGEYLIYPENQGMQLAEIPMSIQG
ncbi:DUF2913 family protein [Vibrio sp. SM6]|uniref:DUF2913 family protein n=1 Tax=Vibrio agarilyticus TaxID=2726741 RepID=A0A7X8TMC2_9VIBR|nr:DUF2913 family protein [Vibrio agarilyticus]NLS11391.1 DUF2913 family protein [Vibrio agarilyticus]